MRLKLKRGVEINCTLITETPTHQKVLVIDVENLPGSQSLKKAEWQKGDEVFIPNGNITESVA